MSRLQLDSTSLRVSAEPSGASSCSPDYGVSDDGFGQQFERARSAAQPPLPARPKAAARRLAAPRPGLKRPVHPTRRIRRTTRAAAAGYSSPSVPHEGPTDDKTLRKTDEDGGRNGKSDEEKDARRNKQTDGATAAAGVSAVVAEQAIWKIPSKGGEGGKEKGTEAANKVDNQGKVASSASGTSQPSGTGLAPASQTPDDDPAALIPPAEAGHASSEKAIGDKRSSENFSHEEAENGTKVANPVVADEAGAGSGPSSAARGRRREAGVARRFPTIGSNRRQGRGYRLNGPRFRRRPRFCRRPRCHRDAGRPAYGGRREVAGS